MAKIFMKCLKDSYSSLETKNPNTFYFCTDTLELFVGHQMYNEPLRVFYGGVLPTNPLQFCLYMDDTNGAGWRHNGSAWVNVIKPAVTVIDATASDDTTATSKAIKDYVDGAVDGILTGSVLVKDAASKVGSNGTVVLTKGDGSTKDVPLTGVAHDLTYDSTNLVITVPMVGKPDLVIDIARDNFVVSGVYNTEDQNIELTMQNGDVIVIPSMHLVDIYTSGSGANDTVSIQVDADNKISATFKVDTTGVLDLSADGTLTIDISDYLTIASFDAKLGDVGADTVKQYIDTNIATAVTNTTAITDALAARTTAIEDALTWGTF